MNAPAWCEIGGDAPISVQTMTAGYTHDIRRLRRGDQPARRGGGRTSSGSPCRSGRTRPPWRRLSARPGFRSSRTCIFHFQRALEAIEAGVHKIRLNPGNISDREQVLSVIDACKERGVPIRIGVNEGSIVERKDKQKRLTELGKFFADQRHGHLIALMITKLEEYLEIFHERDFHDICISAKSMDASLVIDAYTEISKRFDYPLHLGVTQLLGPKETGCIRSVVALGTLLANGIGDTVRISYASDPALEARRRAGVVLYCLGLRERTGAELIACPTCGRIQVDLFTLVQEVRAKLAEEITLPIKVAVMGCIVNGPGEAEGADCGGLRRRSAGHHLRAGPTGGERAGGGDSRPAPRRVPPVPGEGAAGRGDTGRKSGGHRPAGPDRRTRQRNSEDRRRQGRADHARRHLVAAGGANRAPSGSARRS